MSSMAVLKQDIQVVLKDIEQILVATKDDMSEKAVELRRKLEGSREKLIDAKEKAIEIGKDAGRKVNEAVEDNPWHAVGIAATVGLVVGVLIGRK